MEHIEENKGRNNMIIETSSDECYYADCEDAASVQSVLEKRKLRDLEEEYDEIDKGMEDTYVTDEESSHDANRDRPCSICLKFGKPCAACCTPAMMDDDATRQYKRNRIV
ncbi:hypothetical protein NX059_012445 [Plenodomus lindquistii]|nr:hypothetical protein NX059_012445 [Plenodomus lindquistii]